MHDVIETSTGPGPEPEAITDPAPLNQQDADPEPTPARRMIPVGDLAGHPGNVREDLSLSPEFLASVAAEGVRIPLLVTASADGGWLVIEGHRRLAAALRAGLAELPCDTDPGRAGDEAGQYLDMLLANSDSYRANYRQAEEAAALFAAHEAGASRTRLRKATGRTAAQIRTALNAGALPAGTRARAAEACREVTLEELALLAEFDGDQDATGQLVQCLEHGYPLEHAAEKIRRDRAEAAQHARIRADLEAAGIQVTGDLPDGAAWLASLLHDGQDLTPESHLACPGRGAAFMSWNLLEPCHYCTSPADHGHASRRDSLSVIGGSGGTAAAGTQNQPPDQDRRLVVAGNKAWKAAAEVRHRWLAGSLFPRRSLHRETQEFIAEQLLTMPGHLHSGLATARHKPLFAQLTGHDASQWATDCITATTGRLTVMTLAPLVTAYEHVMTDGIWRTDRYSPCPRADAGGYLTFLASLGYPLSDIEQAIADGIPWTGDKPLISVLDPASQADDSEPAPGDADSAGSAAVPEGSLRSDEPANTAA